MADSERSKGVGASGGTGWLSWPMLFTFSNASNIVATGFRGSLQGQEKVSNVTCRA